MLKLYYFLIFKRTLINVYYFFQVSVPELIKKQNFLKKNSIYLLVELFIVRVFYSNYFFRNLKKSKFLIYKKNDDQKLFQERYNTHQIQTETFLNFEKNGFEELGNLDSLFLEKLKEEIFPGISKYNNQTGYYKSLIENESTQTGRLIIKPNNSLKNISSIFNSELIQNITKNYLGSTNISYSSNVFISYNFPNISKKETNKNGQVYHIDCRYKKFYKIFIYLNDVNYENGAHHFIKNSHKTKPINFSSLRLYEDEVVEKNFQDDLVIFEGKEGKVFLEDTFGLHKSGYIQNGIRSILVLEIGNGNIRYDKEDILIKKI